MATNVYASSVAKTVFVWISLILLFIAWMYSVSGAMISGNEQAIKGIPVIGPLLSKGFDKLIMATPYGAAIKGLIGVAEYSGIFLFIITMGLLIIYELFWTPYSVLKGKDNQVNELIERTELARLKKKYESS